MLGLFKKKKIVYVDRAIIPKSSFTIGDDVIVKYITKTKKGKVIGRPFVESSIFNGVIREFVTVQFDDGEIDASWTAITHKL